jgi:hypothetical protein
MAGRRAVDRWVSELERLNPGLAVVHGKRHLKIIRGGKLAGIVPQVWRTEGPNADTLTQLRRQGIVTPGPRNQGTRPDAVRPGAVRPHSTRD